MEISCLHESGMASPVGIDQLFGFQIKSFNLWNIFLSLNILASIYIVLIILKLTIKRRKYTRLLPGKKFLCINILGNFIDFPLKKSSRNGYSVNVFIMQFAGAYTELFQKQKLCCFWMGYIPYVPLFKAEAVEELLSGTKNTEKAYTYKFLHPWLGTGLLTSHGSKWKSRRKLLTPSFHFDILKDFLPVFNEQSRILVKRLQKETAKDFTDIVSLITNCSLDIMCETTLGVSIGAQENRDVQYIKSVKRLSDIIVERMLKFWWWPDFIFGLTERGKQFKKDIKLLHDFTRSIIQEKKAKLLSGSIETSKRKRKAFMDLLLEHHIQTKDLTEDDIRQEVDTFAFEGHDTTSMGMSWALYLIGLHSDVQKRIHEELARIFGDDVERTATTDDIKEMEYLDRVLKESQRLYPSVTFFARQINEETTICGYPIPKGAECVVSTYHLHRDPDVFPNPEKFDPDRFLPQNSIDRHPYAYVPFSAGPRNCIGQRFAVMEEKIVVSTILRNYSIESLDPRDKLQPVFELILKATTPIRIRIRPRQLNNS